MSPHPDQTSGGAIRVGRAILLTAIAVAVGVLLLGRVGQHTATPTASGGSNRHGSGTTSASPPTTATPSTATTLPAVAVPTSQVHIQVLNGVLTGSLSSQWSAKLQEQYGYQTLAPNNATAAVASSTIYVLTTGYLPEAERLASEVGLPASAIVASVPPPTDAPIPSSVLSQKPDLVLVIGPDLASQA